MNRIGTVWSVHSPYLTMYQVLTHLIQPRSDFHQIQRKRKGCRWIAAWSHSETRWHLWTDRSPSLLRVRSCSWYQNHRRELYFRVFCFVFSFTTFVLLVFWKNHQTLCSKPNFFTLQFTMVSGEIQKFPIKIWNMRMQRHYVILSTTK